jgi:SAM-dependent methyltransferase
MIKAAIQGTASLLPGAERWDAILKRRVSDIKISTLKRKIERCRSHLAHYERHRGTVKSRPRILELGTGWFPILPVAFAMAADADVVTVDNADHLTAPHVRRTIRSIIDAASQGLLEGVDPERLTAAVDALRGPARSVDDLLAGMRVTRLVADATSLALPDGSFDLLVSNNTLEHIPGEVIRAILRRFRALAADGAVMSHWIDMTDHYMGFDPSIGPYNFLKYSSGAWRLFNNRLHYQNRLRISDYRTLHESAGWRILEEEESAHDPAALKDVRVAPEFMRYSDEDLLVYEAWIVSSPELGHASVSE